MLGGFTVLDCTGLAGQFAGKLLADLGARVLKVEPPGGDPVRWATPFKDGVPHLEGSLRFAFLNGGKESVVVANEAELASLAARVDVLLESGQPGDLDVAALRAANPGLVVASITGFGQDGPRAGHLAPDIVAFAMGGLMSISGDPDLPPVCAPDNQAFTFGSVVAALGVVLALRRRELTGRGEHVDVSMQEAIATQEHLIREFAYDGVTIERQGSQHKHVAPGRIFECRDGHVFLFVSSIHWKRFLATWDDHPVELDGEQWLSSSFRRANVVRIDDHVERFTRGHGKLELTELLQARGIPCLPVYAPSELIADPHIVERKAFAALTHPRLGDYLAPRLPITLNGERLPAGPAPLLDRHGDPPRARATARREELAMPLEGVRVVSFTTGIAGPHAARLLANVGADVIKVESRAGGIDAFRYFGDDLDASPRFLESNLDVRSVTLNLKEPQGIALAKELIATADVVLENFRPDVLPRLGLGYAELRAVRPDVILARLPGLGSTGPRRLYGTWGPTLAAYSGLTYLWNHEGSKKPVGSQGVYPDYLAGVLVPLVVAAALVRRETGGGGALIDLAQAEAAAYVLGTSYLDTVVNGHDAPPLGNASPDAALHGCFPCLGRDRWCVIVCEDERQWQRLCATTGSSADAADRAEEIARWTRERPAHQAMEILQAAGVPCGVVQTGEDLVNDPHLEARGFIQTVAHPTLGAVRMAGLPFRFADAAVRPYGRAPALGEHNEELLCGLLGYSRGALAAWEAAKIVY